MDDGELELKNLMKVWILAISSLCYCYYISSKIPKGLVRLISLFPVFYLFIILPLNLSSIHFCGVTSFFLVWLANFKLLLFAFDHGPLSHLNELFHFILIACLPIKFKPNLPPKPPQKQKSYELPKSILLVTKMLLLFSIIHAYDYRQHLHQYMVLALYCGHLYLELEIVLALCATPARVLGFELEPQFNEPYLATSLQDFWGRRWNLMVTSILRPTVFNPIQHFLNFRCKIGQKWAQLVGVMASFVVSGLMHEVIYYYLSRAAPTWEVTWFFVLHGMCVAVEALVKKNLGKRWHLHRSVSGPLVVVFVAATGVWLFFPQLFRNNLVEKVLREVFFFVDFIKDKIFYHNLLLL